MKTTSASEHQSADCTGERVYPWSGVCPNTRRQPVGMIVELFGCGPVAVTETLEFEGTSSTGKVFHPTPSVACQDAGFAPGDSLKLFRATKVVNPAERFIPFERKLID